MATDAAVERARAWLDKHDTAESDGWDSCAQMLADFAAEENKALREALEAIRTGPLSRACFVCGKRALNGPTIAPTNHTSEDCPVRIAEAALADELEAERKK